MNHLARVARMSEAISGILLNAACRFAHAGYSLMRVVGIIALFSAAVALFGVSGVHEGLWPVGHAAAREVAIVKLLFGSTWMMVERNLIDYQSSARQLREVAWLDAPEFEVSYNQVVELRFAEIIPAEMQCRKYLKSTFLEPKWPVQVLPIAPIYDDWEQVRMENPEIVKFTTPSGSNEKIDYYQFESDDLRNYLGKKQTFIDAKNVFPDTASVILMDIRIHPEIDLHVSFSSRECFLREGPALTRHIRNFLLQRIRPNS